MRVKCHSQGKFYTIECPKGTRMVRASEQTNGNMAEHDRLVVPLNGREVRIPADPPKLLPLLAESGNFGVSLIGEPEPDEGMAGVVCPGCGETDVAWLRLRDELEAVRCDRCGADFDLPVRHVISVPTSDITKG